MKNCLGFIAMLFITCYTSIGYAQKIDLASRFKNKQLTTFANSNVSVVKESDNGISCNGVVWIKGFSFSTGIIEVDLKGRDVFQQSFLGIAFYGTDTTHYDAIYFRPFNFQSPDPLRKKHTVQYISEPDFPWEKLRDEHPLVYENAVNPFPKATDWFHAKIVVDKEFITVYVNHSATASLKVRKLSMRTDGLFGLWNVGLNGEFANLVVKKD